MPIPVESPSPLFLFFLLLPLLEQDTSYLAASANIFNFSFVRSKDMIGNNIIFLFNNNIVLLSVNFDY
jgi:hypothetical protein